MTYKILITDGLASKGLEKIRELPSIELWERTGITREQLEEILPQVDVLIVRSQTKVDRKLLERATNMKLVLRAGIGLDNVDVEAATQRGIIVMNAPTGNIVTTAEHAIGMMFAVSRNIPQADASMRQGKWEKKKFQGNEIRGKTLGLVGVGNIGKTVGQIACGLGMNVLGHDPYVTETMAAHYRIKLVTLEQLLNESDYISIHVPKNPSTLGMIRKETFQKMKKGAYLINCARGGIVDENSVLEALENGQLSGYAADVFSTEPLPTDHPFLKRDDVVLTPHLGASTDEAQVQVGIEAADQICQFIQDGALKNAVNVPNLSPEQMTVLKPYLKLSKQLGSFSAQVTPPKSIRKIRIEYSGSFPYPDHTALTLSLLKGFLTPLSSSAVNFVNVKNLIRERGIAVEESFQENCEDYASLISLTLEGETSHTFKGTIFGKKEPRIVEIDSFLIDVLPIGHLLYIKNVDQPGVIGEVGTFLSRLGINIARMHLGRDRERGGAISVIGLDSPLSRENISSLCKIKGMLSATQIIL